MHFSIVSSLSYSLLLDESADIDESGKVDSGQDKQEEVKVEVKAKQKVVKKGKLNPFKFNNNNDKFFKKIFHIHKLLEN